MEVKITIAVLTGHGNEPTHVETNNVDLALAILAQLKKQTAAASS